MAKLRDALSKLSFRKIAASIASTGVIASFLVVGLATPATAAACGPSTAPTDGDGNPSSPWQIASAANLVWLSATTAEWTGKYFVQTADLDLMGCDWTPIGTSSTKFTGNYDGQGHTIAGLYYQAAGSQVGMFGWVNTGGAIANVGVVNARLTSTGEDVGALVGNLYGSVTASYSSGAIAGLRSVGGLVGNVQDPGSITDSYSTASVTAPTSVGFHTAGGLVGFWGSNARLTNSWSRGVVVGDDPGGLIASGDPTLVTNSFWDTQTSGQALSPGGGTAKTTAEMNLFSTFPTATWKIVSGWQVFDAATRVWGICSGVNGGYPFLLWQYDSDPCSGSGAGSGDDQDSAPTPAPRQLAATGVSDLPAVVAGALASLMVLIGAALVAMRRRSI